MGEINIRMMETLSNWIFYMTFEVLTEVMEPVF